MDTPQGQAEPVSATPQAQGTTDAGSATLTPEVISKYGAEPSSSPSATEPQGGATGQVQQPTGQPEPDARHFQSLADQRQAEILRLQTENQRLLQEQLQHLQQQTPQVRNPYDPNTQGAEWWKYEMAEAAKSAAKTAADEARKASREEMNQMLQTAYEQDWQKRHPQVNVEVVKSFAKQNGITQLDHALVIMTLPEQATRFAQTQAQQTLDQYKQPQNQGATPLRGSGQAPVPPQLSFDKLAQDFQRTNGAVYNTWPKGLQEAFDKEWALRSAAEAHKK